MHALEALEALEPYIALRKLDVEKAACNIAGKLVELDAHEHAIKFLLHIHTRLSPPSSSPLPATTTTTTTKRTSARCVSSRATSATIASLARSVQRDQNAAELRSISSAPARTVGRTDEKSLRMVLEGLLRSHLTGDVQQSDAGVMSLVVTCMFHAVRCWLGVERGLEIKVLEQLITQSGGLIDSCTALKIEDAAVGGKMFDGMYRTLYKASLNTKEWTPRNTLHLRKLSLRFLSNSPNYSFATWNDHVLKFGSAFEKSTAGSSDEDDSLALLDFYSATLDHAEREVDNVKEVDAKCVAWCEACGKVAKTIGKTAIAQRASACIQKMANGLMGSNPGDVGAAVSLVFRLVEGLCRRLQGGAGGGNTDENDNSFTNVSSAISGLHQSFMGDSYDALYQSDALRVLLRALDVLGKSVRKIVDAPGGESRCPAGTLHVLRSVVELLGGIVRSFETEKKKPETAKVVPLLIDFHTLLARSLHAVDPYTDAFSTELQTAVSLSTDFHYHEGLRWTASTFYNIGGMAYKKKMFGEALRWFVEGCRVLRIYVEVVGGGGDVKVVLSKRLELCGGCAREGGDLEGAAKYYKEAIRTLPIDIYRLLTTPETSSSDRDFAARLLEKYIKLAVSDAARTYESVLDVVRDTMGDDDDDDDEEVLVAIGMKELKVLQGLHGSTRSTVEEQLDVLEALKEVFERRGDFVGVGRMLIEKALAVRGCGVGKGGEGGGVTPVELCREAIEIFKEQEDPPAQLTNELAIAYAVLGICLNDEDRYEAKPFRMAVKAWRKVLRPVGILCHGQVEDEEQVKRVKSQIGDVERTVYYMGLLADYLDVLNQPLNRILVLRLLLKLETLRGNSDEGLSNSVRLYANIATSYVTLGYTGQAGVALSQGKALIDSVGGKVHRGVFRKVSSVGVMGMLEEGGVRKVEGLMCVAFAHFVWANAALGEGTLVGASQKADTALRLLGKAARHSMKRWGGKKNEDGNESAGGAVVKGANVHAGLIGAGRWQILQRFLETYHWLGHLYLRRGSVLEAEHYFREGMKLAKSVRSKIWVSGFLLSVAEMEGRRGRIEVCEGLMGEVEEIRRDVTLDLAVRDVAVAKVRSGDQYVRLGESDEAVRCYEEAEILVAEAMRETVIAALEERELGGTETPRERRLVVASPASRRVSGTGGKRDAATIQYECFVLSYIKAELLSRAGSALGNAGKLDLAEKKLMGEEEVQQRGFEQAEYYTTLANLKVKKIGASLRGNALFEMFSDSAFSLPWGMPATKPVTKVTKAVKAAQVLQKSLAQVEEVYLEAYRHSYRFGSAHMFHQACHGLVLVELMKAYLTAGVGERKEEVGSVAVRGAFYLEMAKGLTARREMLAALSDKLEAKSVKDVEWPTEDNGDATVPESTSNHSDVLTRRLHALYDTELSTTPTTFKTDFIDALPPDWIVCSLSVDLANEDMYVTRMERGAVPVVVRLPMKRQALREGEEDGVGYDEVFEELREVLERSTGMMRSSGGGGGEITREEKVGWWRERKELDGRLRGLVGKVETCWLGGFKGLLVSDTYDHPTLQPLLSEFKETIEKLIYKAVAKKVSSRNKMLPIDEGVCRVLLRLGAEPADDKEVEDALYYLMDAYQYSGVGVDYDEISIDSMTFDFKDALVKFHTDYTKLRSKHQLEDPSPKHIILIPDKHLQSFPWESIPILRGKPVSRVPCLAFLRDRMVAAGMMGADGAADGEGSGVNGMVEVDQEKAFYVLNPGGDLVGTQKEFEGDLRSRREWDGVIGRAPGEDEYTEALEKSSIFLYFGHGGGEQYVRGHRIRKLPKCAVTLLMGCSSGFLQPSGEFDPSGTALNYLMAGSPALVANLWDVTDRDIDRFSRSMMEEWGLMKHQQQSPSKRKKGKGKEKEMRLDVGDGGRKSIVEAVASAREVCHLEYLIGAAPVVYGVPVWIGK
ncbi:hypothetical protein HDV00_012409 [Rhizophlyctis rosea]|nr:hypothetical protein HDV00_012409 [Rhizophlyctis rosea]